MSLKQKKKAKNRKMHALQINENKHFFFFFDNRNIITHVTCESDLPHLLLKRQKLPPSFDITKRQRHLP